MTPRLKGTRTEIVRKNQLRPEIKFFPDGKIKTYFPFTLHSSSCPSIYLLYTHLYVYTYICLCLHVGFFTPRESYDSNTAGRAGTESLPSLKLIVVEAWQSSVEPERPLWPRLIILISSTGISFLFLTYHGDSHCCLYKQYRTTQNSISIFTLDKRLLWLKPGLPQHTSVEIILHSCKEKVDISSPNSTTLLKSWRQT